MSIFRGINPYGILTIYRKYAKCSKAYKNGLPKLKEFGVELIKLNLKHMSNEIERLEVELKLYHILDEIKKHKRVKEYSNNVINLDLCCVCKVNKAVSKHHIIPRKYGGQDYESNFIDLCSKCHDYIEIKTEEIIQNKVHYDIDLLKCLIINNGFD